MKTVILCGGYGTRIRGVADDLPKPMIPIGSKPILWHIMNLYAQASFKDFVLCLGYKSKDIKNFFLNLHQETADLKVHIGKQSSVEVINPSQELNWDVVLAETGLDSMTGDRVRRIKKYIHDDHFFLTYGDGIGNINIPELLSFHKKHGKILTVTGVLPPGRFGQLETKDDDVVGFNEKPDAGGGLISGGFFVCHKRIFDYLPEKEGLVFEQEPMRALARDGQMKVYMHKGFWQPMDTYREYSLLNVLYKKGNPPWLEK